MGQVFIVGAGPGDPEMITLKALRVLEKADVALYDGLVSRGVLDFLPPHCLRVFVGKHDGRHLMPQPLINDLLLDYAQKYPVVVRLKGGDPFVFGRGGEEDAFLSAHGIETTVIAGLSSVLAAPLSAGIPVTHRGTASSFAVITGHEAPDKEGGRVRWESLIGPDTLIFVMGVSRRRWIAAKLIEIGRPALEAVALIEKATTPEQVVYESTLGAIAQGDSLGVSSPAVMIVGEVVRLRHRLHGRQ